MDTGLEYKIEGETYAFIAVVREKIVTIPTADDNRARL